MYTDVCFNPIVLHRWRAEEGEREGGSEREREGGGGRDAIPIVHMHDSHAGDKGI